MADDDTPAETDPAVMPTPITAPEPVEPKATKPRRARAKPVPKAEKPAEKAPADRPIGNVRLVTMQRDDSTTVPAAVYRGDKPRKGSALRLLIEGVIYEGHVADVTDHDGELLVEFVDGLAPILD